MSRLIDADALVEEIVNIDDLRRLSTATIGRALDAAPTIDAIPVEWLNNVMLNCDDEDAKAAWRILHKWNNEHFADLGKMENV
jgi:hypothetical protein